MVMLQTIKATTYVDSKVCTRHGRNLHEILKQKILDKRQNYRQWNWEN